jgi:hypothetical protein
MRVTLRELLYLLRHAPRTMERFIYHRAGIVHPSDDEPLPSPSDDHGFAPTSAEQQEQKS